MKTYILIPVFNTAEVTFDCLRSLQQLDYDNFEVILGDNGSRKPESDKLNRFLSENHRGYPVRLIRSESNCGFGGINNRMCDAVPDDDCFLFFLNNDTTVHPSSLRLLRDAFTAGDAVGGVCPVIVFHGSGNRIWYGGGRVSFRKKSIFVHHLMDKDISEKPAAPYQTAFLTGCALFTSKKIFNAAGRFDERFFLYFEDIDLSFGIRKRGLKLIVCPDALVYHKVGSSSGGDEAFKYYHLTRSSIYFALKNFGTLRKMFIAAKTAKKIASFAFKVFSSQERRMMKPYLAGVKDGITQYRQALRRAIQ